MARKLLLHKMSIIKIFYHQYVGEWYDNPNCPFDLDEMCMPPESVISLEKKSHPEGMIYYDCPAWSHKASRLYNINSPVDISLEIVDTKIVSKTLPQQMLQDYISHNSNVNTIQFNIPRYLFWTNHKNVWIEFRPHPLTSLNNNFISLGGWWNLSAWSRPASFAMDVVDKTKPIVIKRGDPLYQICFYTKNLNDRVMFVKKEPTREMIKQVMKRTSIKNFIRNLSKKHIFKYQEESKCPFAFLYKNHG